MITEAQPIENAGKGRSKASTKRKSKKNTESTESDSDSGDSGEEEDASEEEKVLPTRKRKKPKVESKKDPKDAKIGKNPYGSLIRANNRENVSKNSSTLTGKEAIKTCVELCRVHGKDLSQVKDLDRRRKSDVSIFYSDLAQIFIRTHIYSDKMSEIQTFPNFVQKYIQLVNI